MALRVLKPTRPPSFIIGVLVSLVLTLLTGIFYPSILHWYLIPICLTSGVLGADVYAWLKGRILFLDPAGLVSLLGIYLFVMAPVLLAISATGGDAAIAVPSLEKWIGVTAIQGLFAMIIFRHSRRIVERLVASRPFNNTWVIQKDRFVLFLLVMGAVTFAGQFLVYQMYGGLSGYMREFEEADVPMEGMGMIYIFTEMFPLYAIWLIISVEKLRSRLKYWPALVIFLAAYLGLCIVFGGLRGSRANVVWPMFIAVCLVHSHIARLSRRTILLAVLGTLVFAYLYAFYKVGGSELLVEVVRGNVTLAEAEGKTRRNISTVLIGDFSRADILAQINYRIVDLGQYEYAWGASYLGDIVKVIPRNIWDDKPPSKSYYGALAQYGTEYARSTRVYGLLGEAILNFGPILAPFAFIAYGVVVGWARRLMLLPRTDGRWLFVPCLLVLLLVLLVSDLDNAVLLGLRYVVPILLVWVCSRSVRINRERVAQFVD